MKREILILLFLTLTNFALIAQEENDLLILKISPISFGTGDLITNSLAIGVIVEKEIKKSYSIQQEISYIITNNISEGSFLVVDVDKINGWKFYTEIKKYLSKQKSPLEGGYISSDLRFINTKAERSNWTFVGERISYTVKRLSLAPQLNLGWQHISEKTRCSFDFVVGTGFQYINSNANIDVATLSSSSIERGGKSYDEGQVITFSFRVDLSVGYAF